MKKMLAISAAAAATFPVALYAQTSTLPQIVDPSTLKDAITSTLSDWVGMAVIIGLGCVAVLVGYKWLKRFIR